MPNMKNALRPRAAGVLAVLTLASLGLTACGGSSGSTASQSNAAATSAAGASTSTTSATTTGSSQHGNGAPGPGHGRFAAMRECLQKNGVTLPRSGLQLPKSVTHAQFETALKKCGGGRFAGGAAGFQAGRTPAHPANGPVFKQALARFAACLRQNGVNIPAPNATGKGPAFSTKGIDTSSPKFKTATMKCRGVLFGAFRRKP